MENLTNTAAHMLEDFQHDELTQGEKSKLSREIVTALIALTCLAAGLLFRLLLDSCCRRGRRRWPG